MAATDYLAPDGYLTDASLLGGPDVALLLLASWEAQAGTLATAAGLSGDAHAAAAPTYVYWRAYSLIAQTFLGTETSVRLPDGTSYTVSDKQLAYWAGEAARWRRAWEVATGVASTSASGSVTLRVGF